MTLISCTALRFFHVLDFFNYLISLFHQWGSVIFFTYWFVWLYWHIFAWRLSGSFIFASMRSKFRSLRWRFDGFWCRKGCSRSFIIIWAYMRTIFLNFIRSIFDHTTFCWDIVYTFGFSKSRFNKILHGFFIFLHIWLT